MTVSRSLSCLLCTLGSYLNIQVREQMQDQTCTLPNILVVQYGLKAAGVCMHVCVCTRMKYEIKKTCWEAPAIIKAKDNYSMNQVSGNRDREKVMHSRENHKVEQVGPDQRGDHDQMVGSMEGAQCTKRDLRQQLSDRRLWFVDDTNRLSMSIWHL